MARKEKLDKKPEKRRTGEQENTGGNGKTRIVRNRENGDGDVFPRNGDGDAFPRNGDGDFFP
ncbi:MAG TPA: hypothetical protein P5123_09285, partial [Spirochaetota bacterium]|nr:hypothetical protein [Spirochaetota bacterium]